MPPFNRVKAWLSSSALLLILFCRVSPLFAEVPGIFGYSELKDLIEKHDIRSIDQLMTQLPDEFRENFSLMFSSGSRQSATDEKPRIILRDKSARLLLGISGDPHGTNHNLLEVTHFNDDTKTFEYYRIAFSDGAQPSRPVFSPKNPTECMECHSSELHPIWDTYNRWPGAYGGEDVRPHNSDGMKPTYPQAKKWRSFVENSAGMGRYSFIGELANRVRPQLENAMSPDRTDLLYDLVDKNTQFTLALSELNAERIVRILESSPDYKRYLPALRAALSDDMSFLMLLPESDSSDLERYEKMRVDTTKAVERYLESRIYGMKWHYGTDHAGINFDKKYAQAASKMRFVVERMGLSMIHWPLTRAAGTYAFSDGGYGGLSVIREKVKEHGRVPIPALDHERPACDASTLIRFLK